MDKKTMMKKIVEEVGREKAIELVMHAYDTELLSNATSRLEEGKANMIGAYKRRDHLAAALERVLEVCSLA